MCFRKRRQRLSCFHKRLCYFRKRSFTGAGWLRMKLLPASALVEAIQKLEATPEYTQLLLMRDSEEGNGHRLFQSLMEPTYTISGKAPHDFKFMKNCTNIPSPMEHLSGEQSCRLYEYLDNNGGYQLIPTEHDGDCCFGAMRRGTTWPYEVADAHVRRLVLKAICNFPEFFFDLYKHSLAMTYGLERDTEEVLQQKIQDGTATPDYLAAQRLPGPFSFVGYLKFLSNPSTYADVHILMAMSMIWQLRITCLYAETLHELRFRHHKRIAQADLVFVVCSESDHFVSAGKRLYSISKRLLRFHKCPL